MSYPAAQSDLDPEDVFLVPGARLLAFIFFFGLGVVDFIVELKTGYEVDLFRLFFGRGWGFITQVHGPWSWDEVWTYLPHELSTHWFLPICVVAFVLMELWYRFGWRFGTRG